MARVQAAGTLRLFDVAGNQEATRNHSFFNDAEVHLADQLYRLMSNMYGKIDIGIISPYKQQVLRLKRHFTREYGGDILDKIEFNSVDGFQGQEKDIIIMSCVRASPDSDSVGFLADKRRMNVAFTRARSSMWILGNADTLSRNTIWRKVVNDARNRDMLMDGNRPLRKQDLIVAGSTGPSSGSAAPPRLLLALLQLDRSERATATLTRAERSARTTGTTETETTGLTLATIGMTAEETTTTIPVLTTIETMDPVTGTVAVEATRATTTVEATRVTEEVIMVTEEVITAETLIVGTRWLPWRLPRRT